MKGLIDIFKNKICPFHINHFDSFKNISKMNNVKVFQKQYKNSIFNLILSASNPRTGQTKSNNSSTTCNELLIAPSVVGTPFFKRTLTLFSGYPPLSEANLKSYPSLSKSHPNWCMQIVRNTLKWRCHVLYYNKPIENVNL